MRGLFTGLSAVYPRHLNHELSAVVQQIVDEDVEKERGCAVALSQSTADSYTRGSSAVAQSDAHP
jgi:hypothetical protein